MADPPTMTTVSLEDLCINSIRTLTIDAVQAAKSGHPGAPMALAPFAYALWTRHLRHNPADPDWPGRDRFVLSCGHASMLLYGALHLAGYDLSLDDIRAFRQLGSRTPGHPEYGATPGVETTTGPLGQGIGNAVGMALAASHLATVFNRPEHTVISHRIYALLSDGDLMEGVSHEAASLAGHLRLGNLIAVYDDNDITIDGSTSLSYSEDVPARFAAYRWHVQTVEDGNDLQAIDNALIAAREVDDRPSLIVLRTQIAYGSPNKQGSASAHGAALGEDEVAATKHNLEWPGAEPFHVPDEARAEWAKCRERGATLQAEWEAAFARYAAEHPDVAQELQRRIRGDLVSGWDADLPVFDSSSDPIATRKASHQVLNLLADRLPELMGGAADLAGSVGTVLKGAGDCGPGAHGGRNIHFGVREHAMGSVLSGLALHRGVRPFGGTFLIFADYMRPSIRLAAMMGQPVVYVFSHDSIGVGEDGPTHQPVETLVSLRTIPGLTVLRPADANDTVEAWRTAIGHRAGPVALVLTRQVVPVLDRAGRGPASSVARGGYVLSESPTGTVDVVLLASGSEIHLVIEAQSRLAAAKIGARVVNMVSHELFAAESDSYRRDVLGEAPRLAVEAAHPASWYRWIGSSGDIMGVDRFGRSGPWQHVYADFAFTPDDVVARARTLLGRG